MAGIRIKPGEIAFWGERIPGTEALQVVLTLLLTSYVIWELRSEKRDRGHHRRQRGHRHRPARPGGARGRGADPGADRKSVV